MSFARAIVLAGLLAACGLGQGAQGAQNGPQAWIDAPEQGGQSPAGAAVQVVSHASDVAGIAQFELSVNGAVVRTDHSPDTASTLVTMRQDWQPPGPGSYTLALRAQNTQGTWGSPALAVVTIFAVAE